MDAKPLKQTLVTRNAEFILLNQKFLFVKKTYTQNEKFLFLSIGKSTQKKLIAKNDKKSILKDLIISVINFLNI